MFQRLVFHLLFSLLFFLMICPRCSTGDSPKGESAESVVRRWQKYMDNNEFDKARAISTDRAKEWVDMIASILYEDAEELALPPTEFLQMNCVEKKDSATCVYTTKADNEIVWDSFLLVKVNGMWLVNVAEEEPVLEQEEMEDVLKELEEIINESLEADSLEQ